MWKERVGQVLGVVVVVLVGLLCWGGVTLWTIETRRYRALQEMQPAPTQPAPRVVVPTEPRKIESRDIFVGFYLSPAEQVVGIGETVEFDVIFKWVGNPYGGWQFRLYYPKGKLNVQSVVFGDEITSAPGWKTSSPDGYEEGSYFIEGRAVCEGDPCQSYIGEWEEREIRVATVVFKAVGKGENVEVSFAPYFGTHAQFLNVSDGLSYLNLDDSLYSGIVHIR